MAALRTRRRASTRAAFAAAPAVTAIVVVMAASAAMAAPRGVLGRWPEPVGDERLAELEAAAGAEGADAVDVNRLARAYGSRAQWRRCLESAERALELDPDLVAAHVTLAGAYLNDERAKQAVAAARRAVEIAPDDPSGYYILGWANHKLSRPHEAIAAFESCVRLDPTDPWSEYSLAVAYSGAQNLRRTKRHLEATVALDPPPKLASMAKILLQQVDAVSEAILGSYRPAIEKNPDVPIARVLLAGAYLQLGYDAEAVAEADAAISLLRATPAGAELEPKQRDELADAWRIRGIALVRSERWVDAGVALERAAELAPSHARVLYNLGLVRLRQNDSSEAVALLEKAVSLAPSERRARLALIEAYQAAGNNDLAEHERARLESL